MEASSDTQRRNVELTRHGFEAYNAGDYQSLISLLHPAVEVEDRYRAVLRDNRARDAAAGRTTDGPHLTDLEVLYGPKGIAAALASTGEQKALLIGLVLAHAGLVAEMTPKRRTAPSSTPSKRAYWRRWSRSRSVPRWRSCSP